MPDALPLYTIIGPVIAIIAGILGIAWGAYKTGQMSKLNGTKAEIVLIHERLNTMDTRIGGLGERIDRLLERP